MTLHLEPKDPAGTAAAGADPLAGLRRRREQLASMNEKDFDVPGYGGVLVARYKRLGIQHESRVLLATADDELARYAQFLIDACTGVYRRTPDEGLVPLPCDMQQIDPAAAPGWGEVAPALAINAADARAIVLEVLGGHEQALKDHGDDVYAWMHTVDETVDEQLAGGS